MLLYDETYKVLHVRICCIKLASDDEGWSQLTLFYIVHWWNCFDDNYENSINTTIDQYSLNKWFGASSVEH